jgi:hypothetical protein
VAVFPPAPSGLAERLLGLGTEGGDEGRAAAVARLLEMAGAAGALRLLAPLIAGSGTGIQAGLPYDIEVH